MFYALYHFIMTYMLYVLFPGLIVLLVTEILTDYVPKKKNKKDKKNP